MIERAREAAREIEGWLSDAEGELLFRLAAACRPSATIVEIGSWQGRSTVWLAFGARAAGGRVIAVDPHEPYFAAPGVSSLERFTANLVKAGVDDIVTPIVARSGDAAARVSGACDLLFVDGDHTADGVRRDVELWFPRLADGGVIAFHDVITPSERGPREVLTRLLARSRALGRVKFVDSIAYAKKVRSNTVVERMGNAVAAAGLVLYDARPVRVPRPLARAFRRLIGHTGSSQ